MWVTEALYGRAEIDEEHEGKRPSPSSSVTDSQPALCTLSPSLTLFKRPSRCPCEICSAILESSPVLSVASPFASCSPFLPERGYVDDSEGRAAEP